MLSHFRQGGGNLSQCSHLRHRHRCFPVGAPDAEYHGDFARLAGLQLEIRLQHAAGVVTVGAATGATAPLDGNRVSVAAVGPKECLTIRFEPDDRCPEQRHVAVAALIPKLEIFGMLRQIAGLGARQHIFLDFCVDDILAILKVERVVPHVPFRRKLDVREQIERARPRAVILDTQVPNLVVLAERDEVSTFGANLGVLRFDDRVAGAVATGRAVHFERFADGLPRARPVIAGISIAQVEIAPGLVHGDGVESQTREASLCSGLEEAVAAGIVRNDRAVLG